MYWPPTVYVVDRTTRAVTTSFEVYVSLGAARGLIARAPIVDREDLTSWGHVTESEVEALMRFMHATDQEADSKPEPSTFQEELAGDLRNLKRLVTEYPPPSTFWSLCFSGDG